MPASRRLARFNAQRHEPLRFAQSSTSGRAECGRDWTWLESPARRQEGSGAGTGACINHARPTLYRRFPVATRGVSTHTARRPRSSCRRECAQRSTEAPKSCGTASIRIMFVRCPRLSTAPRRTPMRRNPARSYAVKPATFHSSVSSSTLRSWSTLNAKSSTSRVASVPSP
jgi:hypothetical protein